MLGYGKSRRSDNFSYWMPNLETKTYSLQERAMYRANTNVHLSEYVHSMAGIP